MSEYPEDFGSTLSVGHRFGSFYVARTRSGMREERVDAREAMRVAAFLGPEVEEQVRIAVRADADRAREAYEGCSARQEREVAGLLKAHHEMVLAESLSRELAPGTDRG